MGVAENNNVGTVARDSVAEDFVWRSRIDDVMKDEFTAGELDGFGEFEMQGRFVGIAEHGCDWRAGRKEGRTARRAA